MYIKVHKMRKENLYQIQGVQVEMVVVEDNIMRMILN